MSSPRLLDQVRDRIRVKHYSLRTEEAYLHWIRRFIFFHGKKHPRDMGGPQVEAFLAHLATVGRVAASTQNQALSALLFLYREVLQVDLPWMDGVVRAKRPKHVPVVLTDNEVRALLAHLDGTRWLVVSLLYSSGARLLEGLRLRVKDVDFESHEITVRDGKGARDRLTMLPERLVEPLRSHLARVRVLHERDLAEGYGEVHLPFALARKYPKAGRSWIWQYAIRQFKDFPVQTSLPRAARKAICVSPSVQIRRTVKRLLRSPPPATPSRTLCRCRSSEAPSRTRPRAGTCTPPCAPSPIR